MESAPLALLAPAYVQGEERVPQRLICSDGTLHAPVAQLAEQLICNQQVCGFKSHRELQLNRVSVGRTTHPQPKRTKTLAPCRRRAVE